MTPTRPLRSSHEGWERSPLPSKLLMVASSTIDAAIASQHEPSTSNPSACASCAEHRVAFSYRGRRKRERVW